MKVLVTGGAGYIGSHVVKNLLKDGHQIVVLDNFSYGHKYVVENVLKVPYFEGDIGDTSLLDNIFKDHSFDAVMHFSAFAYVGESVAKPLMYYQNNFSQTINLLEAMVTHKIKKFVFSSTCATYGEPDQVPITESEKQAPINPYGQSKLMVEKALIDLSKAEDIKFIAFRYFNAAGADPDGLVGEHHEPETHLIPLILDAAIGKRDSIKVFGADYDTPDGTCIRDYIHVEDLSAAHIKALTYLDSNHSDFFNLGSEKGYSVLEIINAVKEITGRDFKVEQADRRPGDPPRLVADASKAKNSLGWEAKLKLNEIIQHAWNWHQKLNDV